MPSGGGGGSPSSTNTVQQTVPDWLKGPILENIATAQAQSTAPYVAYEGPRIASLNNYQNQAADLTTQGIGGYKPNLDAATTATNAGATPFSQDVLNQYLDPYRSNVTDEIARLGTRNFNENIMPGVNSQFTGNGMFGSSRNAEILGRAARDTQADITGKQAEYLSKGFTDAASNMNTALGRQMQGGAQLANIAQTGQGLNTNDVSALQAIGSQNQLNQQQLLDTAYNEFITQQDYPKAQTAFLSSIIHGSTPNVNNTTTQNIANPVAQATGLGGTIASALSGNNKAFNKGGYVKAKRAKAKAKPIGLGGMPAYG